MAKKDQFDDTINNILAQKINLLIGTQMIAKGHHFPNLQLVVIVDLDSALFSSDFRSTERFGQLIMQVAGRAGRENPGKVLLQTCYPNHPLMQSIANYNYNNFCNILFHERKLSTLPPYSYQILWRTSGNTLQSCMEFLDNIKKFANNLTKFDTNKNELYKVFGPIPAIMERRHKKFHARLLFQHTKRDLLHHINQKIIEFLTNSKIPSSIKWSIDVDPKEIF
jgi:primosomal protein N' (replication factor Y)